MKKHCISILVISILLSSCTKDSNQFNSPSNKVNKKEDITKNTNKTLNPISTDYEIFGQLHNNTLDYISDKPDFINFSYKKVSSLVEEYALENTDHIISSLQYIDTVSTVLFLKDYADIHASEGKINTTTKNYIYDLQDHFLDYASGEFTTKDEFVNNLKAFENEVFNEKNINVYAKERIILTSVLMRHSTNYWHNVINDVNHPRHEFMTSESTTFIENSRLSQSTEDLIAQNINSTSAGIINYVFAIAMDVSVTLEVWDSYGCPDCTDPYIVDGVAAGMVASAILLAS